MPTPISPDAGDGGCDRRVGVHTALEQLARRPLEASPWPRQSGETLARDSVAIATANVKAGTALWQVPLYRPLTSWQTPAGCPWAPSQKPQDVRLMYVGAQRAPG